MLAPLALLPLVFVAAPSGQEAKDDAAKVLAAQVREALAPVAKEMKDVEFVRARFTQAQTLVLLEDPIETEGTLLLRTDPATLVMEIEGERPTRIRSDATTHTVHSVAERRAERWVFERNVIAASMLACLGADEEALSKAFVPASVTELKADPKTKRPRQVAIALRPKGEQVRRVIEELTITIDPKTRRVVRVAYETPDGDRTSIALSEVELDPEDWKDPAASFSPDLPKGTKLRTRRVPAPKKDARRQRAR